jgi:ACS family tartrate transporter-like MFS transporter
MVFMGWSSDRTGERRWHTAAPCFVVAAAFAAWLFAPATAVAGVALFSLAMVGINARLPGFWSLPTAFLAGTAAAASIGAINCIGNIGGFVGPYLVGKLTDVTGDYRSAVVGLIVFATVAGVLILSIKRPANAPSSRS